MLECLSSLSRKGDPGLLLNLATFFKGNFSGLAWEQQTEGGTRNVHLSSAFSGSLPTDLLCRIGLMTSSPQRAQVWCVYIPKINFTAQLNASPLQHKFMKGGIMSIQHHIPSAWNSVVLVMGALQICTG